MRRRTKVRCVAGLWLIVAVTATGVRAEAMFPDAFPGPALSSQWTWVNQGSSFVADGLTVVDPADSHAWWPYGVTGSSGYTVPAGDFVTTIDATVLWVSVGWGCSRFSFTTADGHSLMFEIYHIPGAPVYRGYVNSVQGSDYSDLTGSHSIKLVRRGETVEIWRASYQGTDWVKIAEGTGFSTQAGTVDITLTSPSGSGHMVRWEKFCWNRFVERFDNLILDGPAWFATGSNGYTGLLSLDNGTLVFDSAADGSQSTYMTLYPLERMDGDFQTAFDFSITRMDYWNNFSLRLYSQDGTWSARLAREHNNTGDHRVVAYYTPPSGAETVLADSAINLTQGTFRLKRTGTVLTFAWKQSGGAWQQVATTTVPASAVAAAVGFNSAGSTRSVIRLNSYQQEWATIVPRHTSPDYSSPKVLASENGTQTIRLVFTENCDLTATKVKIQPGGRAVYAVQAPLNIRDLDLMWQSLGALKVSVTRLGGAETLELGETLLWDNVSRPTTEIRGIDLDAFVTRRAAQRGWTLTHATSDNFYFVTFERVLDDESQVIVFRNTLWLHGSELMPLAPFTAETTSMATATSENGTVLLNWPRPPSTGDWWGQNVLPRDATKVLGGIPFKVSPTVLGAGYPTRSAAIELGGQTAGLIHFAHTTDGVSGGIPLGQDWMGEYMIVYTDGTTETIFCSLEWNCGLWEIKYRQPTYGNYTWWGSPGFTWAKVHRLPNGNRSTCWAGVYVAGYINPHPEKPIRRILVYVPPEVTGLALLGISLTRPEDTCVGLIEPSEAALRPTDQLRTDVMLWRPVQNWPSNPQMRAVKLPGSSGVLISADELYTNGPFAMASYRFWPRYFDVQPGPVCLEYRDNGTGPLLASSSRLGWMPPGPDNFTFTMIGQAASRGEYERIRRLGYDSVKVVMTAVDSAGQNDIAAHVDLIQGVGLTASIRNHPQIPGANKQITPGGATSPDDPDKADSAYVSAVKAYYNTAAGFAQSVGCVNMNPSYGCQETIGNDGQLYYGLDAQWPNYRAYLQGHTTLAEINAKSGTAFTSWDDIQPNAVRGAPSPRFLEAHLLRAHNQDTAALQGAVVAEIRAAGFTGHLSFNTAYHHQVQRWRGEPFDEYLTLGRDNGPGSPFNESADRVSLSFFKWLAAKRTFGLPYGDEGWQPGPTYEHNVMAYQWMMQQQCRDAAYCGWYYGNPGSQNIAWLKPFYRLIYDAEYLPDPITLALSFESGYEEAPEALVGNGTGTALCHYGLVNVLRELNMNADRYIIDKFPEKDAATTAKLILDDNNRYIDDGFADRLAAKISAGGVFVATGETDRLRSYAFLSRFGLTLTALANQSSNMTVNGVSVSFPVKATSTRYKISGSGLTVHATWSSDGSAAVVSKNYGSGKIVVFGKAWDDGDAIGAMPPAYLEFCRSKFQTWGGFVQKVDTTDRPDYAVHATPYRAANGSLYVHLFNTAATPKTVDLAVNDNQTVTSVTDLGAGITWAGNLTQVTVTVPELSSTLIVFGPLALSSLPGDANEDSRVTFEDFSVLQNHYGRSGASWSDGDFDGDGYVTFADFGILQNHYGLGSGESGVPAAESAGPLSLCGLVAVVMLAAAAMAATILRNRE